MKSIGIVISSYNKAEYLEHLFITLTTQANPFDQIVFVDDDSTDSSKARFLALLEKYEIPIEYFFGNHVGTFENKKRGLQYLNTDYVIFLDADDRLVSSAYKVIQNVISGSNDLDSYVTNLMTITTSNELIIEDTNTGFTGVGFLDRHLLRKENLSPGPGSIFPTKILQNTLSQLVLVDYLHDDWLMFAMLLSRGYKVIPSKESFYIYVPNESSVSRAKDFGTETNKTRSVVEHLINKNELAVPLRNSFLIGILNRLISSFFHRLLYYARRKKIFIICHDIIKRFCNLKFKAK